MADTDRVNVSIMVDDAHVKDLASVKRALRRKGFELKDALTAIGVLTGSAPTTMLAELSEVPGVTAVEPERDDYTPQG